MIGRSTRTVCLVVAVWAVLFAPGAFRGDAASAGVERDLDDLGAAIIAPTFGTDGLHAARPCWVADTEVDGCGVVAGALPALAVLLVAALSVPIRGREPAVALVRRRRLSPPRAPPAV